MDRQASRGFTLLELLVAIAIFAVISLGGYRMLVSLMESHERVTEKAGFHEDLNLAMAIMGRDFQQFVFRGVKDPYGEPLDALILGGDYAAEFTRAGWPNPGARPRSNLQRVAYSIDYQEASLKRHFWLVLDRAEDSVPVEQLLLTGVKDLQIAPLSPDQNLTAAGSDVWPPPAVEVAITTTRLGEIRRVFQLPDSPPGQP